MFTGMFTQGSKKNLHQVDDFPNFPYMWDIYRRVTPWTINGWNLQNHPFYKGEWSEPNLQGIMFQPLIFRGVPTFTHQVETFCEIESVSEVLPWTFAVTVEAVDFLSEPRMRKISILSWLIRCLFWWNGFPANYLQILDSFIVSSFFRPVGMTMPLEHFSALVIHRRIGKSSRMLIYSRK